MSNAVAAGASNLVIEAHRGSDGWVRMQWHNDLVADQDYQPGLGIGLKLSKRLLQSMGGELMTAFDGSRATVAIKVKVHVQ